MDHSSGNNDKELFERVTGFVSEFTAKKAETIRQETSLYHDLGVDGEDAIELLDSFSAEFEVDVRNFPFDDYFGNEGGTSPFNLITSPDYSRRGVKGLVSMD